MSFYTPFAFIQSAAAPVTDPDALAYVNAVLAAGGTLSDAQQIAIDNLYLDLKSNSLYTELVYMYPFMGATAAAHAVEGLNPTDADYTLTWAGDLTNDLSHTDAGVNTLVVGVGYGHMAVNTNVLHSSVNDVSLGGYVSTATTNDQCFFIAKKLNTVGSSRYQMNIPFDSNNVYSGIGGAIFAIYNNGAAPTGRWITSRTSSTLLTLYKNGSSVATQTGTNTGTLSADAPEFFAADDSLAGNNPFQGICGFIFGGNGLSGAEVSTLDGIISTFLTAVGR